MQQCIKEGISIRLIHLMFIVIFTQDVIKVHFALLRAIDLNMVSGGSGLGKIFLDFKERLVTLNSYMACVYIYVVQFWVMLCTKS